jgi:hypothetical protein
MIISTFGMEIRMKFQLKYVAGESMRELPPSTPRPAQKSAAEDKPVAFYLLVGHDDVPTFGPVDVPF